MKIELKVIARAKEEAVEKVSEGCYRVKVSAPPEKGKANKRVMELLADELGVKKRDIKIISGAASNRKVLEVG